MTVIGCYILYFFWLSSNEIKLTFLTATISIVSLIYSQSRNTRRDIDARHFSQKAQIYEDIISTIGGLFKESKGWADPAVGDELAKKLFDIQTQLLVWAGPEVLLAWEHIKVPSQDTAVVFKNAQRLLAALRRELGHNSDNKLGKFGLIKVYIIAQDHAQIDAISD